MTSSATIPGLDPVSVRRILVCQLRQIGDVLLATPSIGLLKKRFPDAEIHLLTEKKTLSVIQGHPDIAKVHTVDRKAHRDLRTQFAFYLEVARNRYDIVIDFQQLPRIRWVVALSRYFKPASGRQVRLSYDAPWYNRWMYTHTQRPDDGYAAMSKASVMRPLGIQWNGEAPLMRLSAEELAGADAILQEHGVNENDVLVTVDPSHRRETRRWPAEHYGELIAKAAKQDKNLKFIVFYGPGEESDARAVAQAAKTPACIVTEKMLTIREMAAVIARAKLHIGNCSAPRHIAVAVGTPALVMHGSTSDAWSFPGPQDSVVALDIDCRPCNENTCPNGTTRCMKDLLPDTVLPELMSRVSDAEGGDA